jgi:hypothetical protein
LTCGEPSRFVHVAQEKTYGRLVVPLSRIRLVHALTEEPLRRIGVLKTPFNRKACHILWASSGLPNNVSSEEKEMDLLCIPRGGLQTISTRQDISVTLVGFRLTYGEGVTSTNSQNPGLQNLRTAITSFWAFRRQQKKHAFTLLLSLSIPL